MAHRFTVHMSDAQYAQMVHEIEKQAIEDDFEKPTDPADILESLMICDVARIDHEEV